MPLACNVFASFDRCSGDGDCPTGQTCDREGRFCASPADAAVDASITDADAGSDRDADADAARAPCDSAKPFATVSLVRGLETTPVLSARFTSSELTILLAIVNGGSEDLFSASRLDRDAGFTLSGAIPGVNKSSTSELWPTLSADGKLMFFESNRALTGSGNDQARVWSAQRNAIGADFETPKIQTIFALDAGDQDEGSPYLHPSGRSLYFISFARPGQGDSDIFVAQLDEIGLVTAVKNAAAVNTALGEYAPVVSLDDTLLYFARQTGTELNLQVYESRRATPTAELGPAQKVGEIASAFQDFPSWVSDDRCRLYFLSNRPAAGIDAGDAGYSDYRLWVAERPPAAGF